MKLSPGVMLDRFLARDRSFDGRFVTGVVTTGIYCLPSCSARKPKPENVRFFATEDDARAAGLRPCLRCHPDDFYADRDPELTLVQTLDARVRAAPGEFATSGALARAAGFGATRLGELVRRHFHDTPAGYLLAHRLAAARTALLQTDRRVLDIALDAGFDGSSAFHDNFKRATGMPPRAYRRLRSERSFALELPADFRVDDTLAYLARSGASPDSRRDGRSFAKALLVDEMPVVVRLELTRRHARCCVDAQHAPGAARMAAIHTAIVRLLGLGCDNAAFERRAAHDSDVRRLVRARPGLRVCATADPFEGLVWAITGQQVNLGFAAELRATVLRAAGTPAPDGLTCHPSPEQVAALDHADLTRNRFSRRKAEYLIDTARAIANGTLPFASLARGSVIAAERALLGTRGLGPWSVQYVLMRSFGRADCVPVGDTGLATALERFFALAERPDAAATERLMAPFAPHRSLAAYHLWRSLGDEP